MVLSEHTAARRGERGFTLIELLVVMIIVAVLMAVAVPTFLSQKSNARKTKALQNIEQIKKAVETCAARNTDGSYAGCAEHSLVWAFDKGLKDIPRCCTGTPIDGWVDLNGIDANNRRVGSPTVNDHLYGFEIYTWMRDGDREIWFQLAHWPDGTVARRCGAGRSPSWSKAATSGVPGSRVCTTGTW